MNQILLNILAAVTTCIILPLISFLGIKLSQWLSSKIKDEKAARLLNQANEIVINAVKSYFKLMSSHLKIVVALVRRNKKKHFLRLKQSSHLN